MTELCHSEGVKRLKNLKKQKVLRLKSQKDMLCVILRVKPEGSKKQKILACKNTVYAICQLAKDFIFSIIQMTGSHRIFHLFKFRNIFCTNFHTIRTSRMERAAFNVICYGWRLTADSFYPIGIYIENYI